MRSVGRRRQDGRIYSGECSASCVGSSRGWIRIAAAGFAYVMAIEAGRVQADAVFVPR